MIRKEKKEEEEEKEREKTTKKKMRDAHTKYQTGRAGGLICFEGGRERERQQLEAILMFVREGGKFFRIFFMIIY